MKRTSIYLIITLITLTSCLSSQQPFTIKNDFVITEVKDSLISCFKEECKLQIDNRRIKLSSIDYDLDIQMEYFYEYKRGIGKDQYGNEWDIQVYNFKTSPYLVTFDRDSINITVGYQCTKYH